MIEEGEYLVRGTIRNVITFSPIERATPLSEEDAIENAKGTVFDDVWEALKAEGWEISFTAERIY